MSYDANQHRDESWKRLIASVPSDLGFAYGDTFSRTFDEFAKSIIPSIDFKLDSLLPGDELESIQNSMSGMWETLFESLTSVLDYHVGIDAELLKRITQQAEHALKPIQFRLPEIDWSKANDGAKKWGEYGWTIPDSFSFHDVCNPPNSLLEANSLCKKRCGAGTNEFMQVRQQIVAGARKKHDTEVALELFDRKLYKPCAMMLCSLVEGEIRHRAGRASRAEKPLQFAKGKVDDLRDMAASLALAVNYEAAIRYFFRSTKSRNSDFDMTREGELNRNILMHGMMYKPVRQQTCLKLFCLYSSTIRLIGN